MKIKRISFIALAAVLSAAILGLALLAGCDGSPKEIPPEELELLTSDIVPKTDGDVRIMSANVLVRFKSWGGESVLSRAGRFARAVSHYRPDVIGAQEFCSDWYKKLMPRIENDGYVIIKEKYSAFTENRTPIIYNSRVLELKDHGLSRYSRGDDNGCRVVSWAVFERRSDGKAFAVTSTHLDLIRGGKEDEELEIMLEQVGELFEVVSGLVSEYACPVYMCGDYNCMEERGEYLESEYYGSVGGTAAAFTVYNKIAAKYADAKYAENILRYDAGGGILPEGAWSSPSWDHIFYTGETSVRSFAILSSLYFQRYENRDSRVSDHLPIFADFIL